MKYVKKQRIMLCLVACIILLFFWCDLAGFLISKNNIYENQPEIQAKQKTFFEKEILILKSKYPSQTVLFWANIVSSYRHTILKSKDPAIILIVSDRSTRLVLEFKFLS